MIGGPVVEVAETRAGNKFASRSRVAGAVIPFPSRDAAGISSPAADVRTAMDLVAADVSGCTFSRVGQSRAI
jgi:hypothetical protein